MIDFVRVWRHAEEVTDKERPLVARRQVDLGRMKSTLLKAGRTQLPSPLANHSTEVFWISADRRPPSFA
jgi:hypothetical protein